MKKDQFKSRIVRAKSRDAEISAEFIRTKRLEGKGRIQKMRAIVEKNYGDFKNGIQHDDDFEDDIRFTEDFRIGDTDE